MSASPTPFHAAAAVPSVAGFTNDLAAHLEPGGFVISCPAYFLMARPVPRGAPMEQLLNPWQRWPDAACDTWMVWLAAGHLRRAMEAALTAFGPREWVAFQTRGPVRFRRLSWVRAVVEGRGVKVKSESERSLP